MLHSALIVGLVIISLLIGIALVGVLGTKGISVDDRYVDSKLRPTLTERVHSWADHYLD